MMLERLKRGVRAPVSKILTGSILGQGAILLASPLLTRLYSASDFAAFAAVTSVSAILGAVVTLSWDRSIVVPTSDRTAGDLLTLGLVTTASLSLVFGLCIFLTQDWLSAIFGSVAFDVHWWVVPTTVFFMGVYALISSMLVRRRLYGSIAIRNGVQGGSQAISSVLLGALGFAPFGLIVSLLIGRIGAVLGLFGQLRNALTNFRDIGGLRSAASRYRKFPLISTWSRLLNSMGLQLPILLIIALYTSVEAGLFALTVRVLASPVGIISDAVSQYFEGTFSHRVRIGDDRLVELLRETLLRLTAVAVIPTAAVVAVGPGMFQLLFGSSWEGAGEIARFMVISYFAQFVAAPVSRTLQVLERQGLLLCWDASRALMTTAAVALPHALGYEFQAAVATLTAVQASAYLFLVVACLTAARHQQGVAANRRGEHD